MLHFGTEIMKTVKEPSASRLRQRSAGWVRPHLYSCEGWRLCPAFLTPPDMMHGRSLSIISFAKDKKKTEGEGSIHTVG